MKMINATIRTARVDAGITQEAAAELVHVNRRTWIKWEHGERQMPLAAWELFLIKTGQTHKTTAGNTGRFHSSSRAF